MLDLLIISLDKDKLLPPNESVQVQTANPLNSLVCGSRVHGGVRPIPKLVLSLLCLFQMGFFRAI
jgi:hypothetical protein